MRGGKREGSGRKASPDNMRRETVSVRLPRWLIDALGDENRSALVEKALCRLLKLKPPVDA